ncbi:MAG TPA: NAD(+)/NADH kinase, partial [Thermogutta sp.]|nr:NAD(+)/NADH kinase [Thermogutta sp.]
MKVIVLGYGGRADVVKEVERFLPIIERYAEILLVDLSGEKDLSPYQADYVIVFGGDGSILRAARQMGKKQFPVIAVNLGKLGFLADISPQELEGVLSLAEHSRLPVVDHLMLSSELVAQGS